MIELTKLDFDRVHRICLKFPIKSRGDLLNSLLELTPGELKAVEEASETYAEHLGSVAHDIHGIARCKNGPVYHRDTFLPRVVKWERIAG